MPRSRHGRRRLGRPAYRLGTRSGTPAAAALRWSPRRTPARCTAPPPLAPGSRSASPPPLPTVASTKRDRYDRSATTSFRIRCPADPGGARRHEEQLSAAKRVETEREGPGPDWVRDRQWARRTRIL